MTMSFDLLWAVIRGRWLLAMAVWLVVVGLVAGLTAMMPRYYEASAAVVLDVKSPDPIAGIVLPMATTSYMSTQADVLRSDRVLLKAIEATGFDREPEVRALWRSQTEGRGDYLAWVLARVHKRLDVRPGRDSNVLTLSFSAKDPVKAAAMANAVMRGYLSTSVELRTEPARDFNSFFDERAKQLRGELEASQRRLSEYEKREGLLASDDRIDLETARLADLSRRVIELQSAASESGNRERSSESDASRMTEVLMNPAITALKAELVRADARLGELGGRLGDSHPQVVEARLQQELLQKRLDAETARAAGSAGVQNNINQRRYAEARAAYEAQRVRVLQLKSHRDDAAVLARDVQSAQAAYDAGLAQLNRASLESQATRANASVLKEARVPAHPSSPVVALNLLLGIVVATLAAVAAAVAAELRAPKLRLAGEAATVVGLPVLVRLGDSRHASRASVLGLASRTRAGIA